ncbi:sensor histidine kinase [Rhodovibrionaceae bacterium A322]
MKKPSFSLPPMTKSLSASLLVLTVAFVMLAEVLIFTPSIGRFRTDYLQEKLATAHLAVLALEATPDNMVSKALEKELLEHVNAYAIAVSEPHNAKKLMLMVESPGPVEARFDLAKSSPYSLVRDAFATLFQSNNRLIEIAGNSPHDPSALVEVIFDEGPLQDALLDFGLRILLLSLFISAVTAALVFLSLHLLFVRPMRNMTRNMLLFSKDPEDESRIIQPSNRQDEIGLAQKQLQEMQRELRASLHQKTRLAALGQAVTKINHDLRNILATAQLVSDRLAQSDDPDVKRNGSTVIKAIDRAVKLCSQTLSFTGEGPAVLDLEEVKLSVLVDEVGEELPASLEGTMEWVNQVPADQTLQADRDQLFRVLHNLSLNALQAGATRISLTAQTEDHLLGLRLEDNGPGLSPRARQNLFRPFSGSTRAGGSGLGLAIARELCRAHGGDLTLERSDHEGTAFYLKLPKEQAAHLAAQ